jgi:hypothetical protein
MQEIRNFIEDRNVFNDMKEILTGENFSWYFRDSVAHKNDRKDFYFGHIFYEDNEQKSLMFNRIISPIIGRLKFNYLIRCRANMYTRNERNIAADFHTDFKEDHKVALFSINTCNGYTLFKDGSKVLSEENKIVIFDGKKEHASVTQTDTKQRINININFIS